MPRPCIYSVTVFISWKDFFSASTRRFPISLVICNRIFVARLWYGFCPFTCICRPWIVLSSAGRMAHLKYAKSMLPFVRGLSGVMGSIRGIVTLGDLIFVCGLGRFAYVYRGKRQVCKVYLKQKLTAILPLQSADVATDDGKQLLSVPRRKDRCAGILSLIFLIVVPDDDQLFLFPIFSFTLSPFLHKFTLQSSFVFRRPI